MSNEIIYSLKLKQLNSKPIYNTVIKFSLLRKICKITSRLKNSLHFQREHNQVNVNNIIKFIIENSKREQPVVLFPTPIILAHNILLYDNDELDDKESDLSQYKEVMIKPYKDNVTNFYEIILNEKNNEMFLIVDGQHRFLALEEIFKKNEQKGYSFDCDLNVTFLFDHNLQEQAEIFTNVNFNQKPMSKSLVYDIFGTSNDSSNKIYNVIYKIIYHLNSDINSALNGKIKILGIGCGIISQAFFTETLKKLLINSERGFFNDAYRIINSINEREEIKNNAIALIIKVLEIYFDFIKKQFIKTWPLKAVEYIEKELEKIKLEKELEREPDELKKLENKILILEMKKNEKKYIENFHSIYYKDILLKTTGFYCLLNLLELILTRIEFTVEDIKEKSNESIEEKLNLTKVFKKFNNEFEEKYFSKNSKYAKGTGKKMQNDLLEELKENLSFEDKGTK